MYDPEVRVAKGFWLWLLNRLEFDGVTNPFGNIHVRDLSDKALIRHELVHAEQIRRLGRVGFALLYVLYLLWYGYRRNPLEVEAYARAPL